MSTGFLIKQRAYIKVYLLKYIASGRYYGNQMLEYFVEDFGYLDYVPPQSEIYRALHELEEEDYIKSNTIVKEGTKRQNVVVYSLKDKEKVNAYKKLAKADLDRSMSLINKAVKDNFS